MDRWQSSVIPLQGGLILNIDALTQGTQFPGSARILQNYEPAIGGGYRRINGHTKYDSTTVPGTTNAPITGIKVALGGVFAVRKLITDNAIYFSTGTGWSSKLNAGTRTGTITKSRFVSYSITEPVIVLVDGTNYAWKYNGTVEATINGTGAPAAPEVAEVWNNRLALAAGPILSVSAPNDDEDFDAANGAFELNIGDEVVGLKTFRDDLYIFCENSIKMLAGQTIADFQVVDITKSIGCLSGDSIQEVGGDLIFLAPDGFRSLAATTRIGDIEVGLVSKQIQPLMETVLGQNYAASNYSSVVIRKKSQYRLFINDSNALEADSVGFLGRLEGRGEGLQYAWATLKGIKPYCASSEYLSNREVSVIGHPTSGYVYRLESGNDFDGTAIPAVYRTPDITFDDATIRKVFQKLSVYTQVEGDTAFAINLKLDREITDVLQPQSILISQMGGISLYGTALYDTALYGEFAYPVFNTNLIGAGFTGAFYFSSTNSLSPHRIDSFQVQLAVKAKR